MFTLLRNLTRQYLATFVAEGEDEDGGPAEDRPFLPFLRWKPIEFGRGLEETLRFPASNNSTLWKSLQFENPPFGSMIFPLKPGGACFDLLKSSHS